MAVRALASLALKPRIFKRIPGRRDIVFVGSRKEPFLSTRTNTKMTKLATDVGMKKFSNVFDDIAKLPKGTTAKGIREQLLKQDIKVLGTVGRFGKNGRVFISRDAVRAGKIREIVHHERFHQRIPIIGKSEIGAHFVGGLLSKRKKLSPLVGLKSVNELISIRPGRFIFEAGAVGGIGAGIHRARKEIQNRREQQRFTSQKHSRSEAARKAWVTRRRLYGQDGRRD